MHQSYNSFGGIQMERDLENFLANNLNLIEEYVR
jgi:hypothetical protein